MKAIELRGSTAHVLDQTALPGWEVKLEARNATDMEVYIKRLSVRGAPNLGIAGAMGIAAAVMRSPSLKTLKAAHDTLSNARPTAVNLKAACDQVLAHCSENSKKGPNSGADLSLLAKEAVADIEARETKASHNTGTIGADSLEHLGPHIRIMTICNTGWLAAPMWGTALAPVYALHERGISLHVDVLETRPLLQGARLTLWELDRAGIPCTLLTDGMAATRMLTTPPDIVLVGADRIAINGDVANKVGTYELAIAAKYHRIPLWVVAPVSTLDPNSDRLSIDQIEQRHPEEVRRINRELIAPPSSEVHNPAFDITPSHMVDRYLTDQGLIEPSDIPDLTGTSHLRATASPIK